MKERLFIIALAVLLVLAALPALPAADRSVATALGVAYADDGEPTPTPTATPALPAGSCQSGGHCGD